MMLIKFKQVIGKGSKLIVIFLVISMFIPDFALAQSILYVAGDGTGDFNCDGVSDQIEINEALDSVATDPNLTSVYLKGNFRYTIDEPVIISSNTIFTGDSTAVLYLKDSIGWWTHFKPVIGQKNAAAWDAWGQAGDSISNVEIYGFEINGGNQLEPAGDTYIPLIHFYFPQNISIHDMHLQASYWDVVRMTSNANDVNINTKIYNNRIEDAGHEGICFVKVTHCYAYNNTILHTRTNCGIRAKDTDTIYLHDNIISNSFIKNPSGYTGILVENKHDPLGKAEIYGNVIYGKNGGIHLTGDGASYPIDSRKNAHIFRNKLYKINKLTNGSGFEMEGGIKIDGFQNTVIENNVIESGESDGIVYQGTSGGSSGYTTIVKNNIIINNKEYGISNEESANHSFIANNNLVYNNTSGNYYQCSSSDDVNSEPLFGHTHSTLNNWHHIVATYSNSTETFKLYVDGKKHASKTLPGFGSIGTNSYYLYLGKYLGIDYYQYQGRMDELAIWNKALTQTDVATLYNNGQPQDITGSLTNDMQVYLQMENNWNDSSGNGYNAVDSTASFTSDAFNGSYAGWFDSTLVQYPYTLSTTNGLTISVWVYRTSTTEELQTIVNKGSQSHNDHIWLYFQKESVVFELGNGTDRYSLEANVINPEDFDYHLKSQIGRWEKDRWVKDTVTSPCIDNGDLSDDYSNELAPNGERINIGIYGNTVEASKSIPDVYYVKPTGDDSNSGLSIADAWQTIAYAASSLSPVKAGDTVLVLQGTYNERVIFEKSGMDSVYTVFKNYQNDDVVIDGTDISWGASGNGLVDISGKNLIEFTGFSVTNSDYASIRVNNSEDITIKNDSTYNSYSSGICVLNSNNILVQDNKVNLACNDGDRGCISIVNSSNCDVFQNKVHDNGAGTNGGEGIKIKQGSHDIKVYQNEVYNINERIGIYVDAWDQHTYNIDVFNNKIHHCGENGFNAQTEMGGLLEYVNFYNNLSYMNKLDGIAFGSSTVDPNVTVTPVKHIKVINNTCYKNGVYQNGWGYGILVDNDDLQDITIRNNICSRNSSQMAIENFDTIQQIDHNLLYGYNGTQYSIFGSDSLIADPVFMDTINFDFHLQEISPAIDFGIIADSPAIDLDSVPRPLLANPDLGAYEYGIYWTGELSNDWHTAGNWSNNQVPGTTDKVTIPSPEFYRYYPKVNTNEQINGLFLNQDATIKIIANVIFNIGL